MVFFLSNNDQIIFENFISKEGVIPIWDNPYIKGNLHLPTDYRPATTLESVLNLYKRMRYDEEDIRLLKVIGDAICANEDQLRRYMNSLMSRSEVSKRLTRMRNVGLVYRWKMRTDDDKTKPPAPFTLGIAGYKFLKHYYNDTFFMSPDRWDDLGPKGIQRYVALNEIRCQLVERKLAKKWVWNPELKNNYYIKNPLAAAHITTDQGNFNFVIDRAQMSQNFVGYLRTKLNQWKEVHNSQGSLLLSDFPEDKPILVLSVSTISLAAYIQEQLILDSYPFHIWLCVDEANDFTDAFYKPTEDGLKKIRLTFM